MEYTTSKEIKLDFPGIIRVYKDGSIDRLMNSPLVPPTLNDAVTGVSSKDITISDHEPILARLYLPNLTTTTTTTLPILVYFHGGGFCFESAFSFLINRYMTILASQAKVIIVSVEYRLAPEYPLPIGFEDCWKALNLTVTLPDPWLTNYGDLDSIFVGGDSAGGNIVHYVIMRAGIESLNKGVKIKGAFLSHPFFLVDKNDPRLEMGYKIWEFVYPDAPNGPDNPWINPVSDGGPSLKRVGCRRMLVVVAKNDEFKEGGIRYYEEVKKSGFEGKLEFYEAKGEQHCFHVFDPETEDAKLFFQCLVSFLRK